MILELDHADFLVKDRQGLSLLFTALRLGLQGHGFHSDRFPVDLLYRHWKHADSQVNLIDLQSLQVECETDFIIEARKEVGYRMILFFVVHGVPFS